MANIAKRSRGSDKLTTRLSSADLAKLQTLGRMSGVSLVDFFPNGIPAPDGVWGVFHVQPKVLSSLLDRLMKQPRVPQIHIFPKGIPRPDLFEVNFEIGSARQR